MSAAVLSMHEVVKHYRRPREQLLRAPPVVQAVRGVSLTVASGRSLGIVGESGSGKSTLARIAMALETPSGGEVRWLGRDVSTMSARELRTARRDVQMVFQDPYGSLDPRQRIAYTVAEPLEQRAGPATRDRVSASLEAVGLSAGDAAKFPHEFSGGQRQRIAIARALITRPKLIVADEPVSALDVSVQAQVLNLMADLQDTLGLTYLFISHDLAVVNHVCDDVAVMYAGRIVEQGTPEQLFLAAAHPYTRALVGELPRDTLSLQAGAADRAPTTSARVGSLRPTAPAGCSFAHRCAHRQARCEVELPALRTLADDHRVACHEAESVLLQSLGENAR